MTRSQVATRLGVRISTVRRFEGTRLHPTTDEHDVRWFTAEEVANLASELANSATRASRIVASKECDARGPGEVAALVFERLERRQSLAEIVIGLRIEPGIVRTLFDEWSLGLTEGHLRNARQVRSARENEIARASDASIATMLAALPRDRVTRISVARHRGPFHDDGVEFADLVELGGFQVVGPFETSELVARFGPGDFRVTASSISPSELLWECLVEGLA